MGSQMKGPAKEEQKETFETHFNYISVFPENGEEGGFASKTISVHNGRQQDFKLRGDGVQLLQDVYLPVENFFTDTVVLRNQLNDQMSELAKRLTGAYETFVFPPLVRSEAESSKKRNTVSDLRTHINQTRPHDIVHNDYAVGFMEYLQKLEPNRLRYYLATPKQHYKTSEELASTIRSAKRMIVVQFWASAQPDGTVIEHHPLAICAPRSVKSPKHCIPVPLPEYGGVKIGENFNISLANAAYSKDHEWFYFPNMTRKEMLAWIGYDSDENPLLPPFHSAFDLPKHLAGSQPRESIEFRVLCLVDHHESFLPRRRSSSSPNTHRAGSSSNQNQQFISSKF